MYHFAVVEDEKLCAEQLVRQCERYSEAKGEEFQITHYEDPFVFLDKCRGQYDAVFMDIRMPVIDGMTCARRMREKDGNVLLCFVTSMAQYAIQGYEVGAFDFMLKPVTYGEFSLKMDRILRALKKRVQQSVIISNRSGIKKIELGELMYVEVFDHKLIYHTVDGDVESTGKLKTLEDDPNFSSFIRVSQAQMVNAQYITGVEDDMVLVGDVKIPLPRRRRKECLIQIAKLLGGA